MEARLWRALYVMEYKLDTVRDREPVRVLKDGVM